MSLEQIFEFIMSNLFLVVLIVGGLLSFFKRAAQGGEAQQGKQMGWPGREEQQSEVDWKEIFKQEEPIEQKRQEPEIVRFEPVETPEVQTENEKLYEQLQEMRKRREQVEDNVEGSKPSKRVNEQKRERLDLHLNRLSNKEAMKAVVWAEVLGKPRSRQPHQSFNQRTKIR
ncbi:hypothetical protein [Halalkalibacter urbisdiaboli]|uniref:hypothetical protein n=1 Tax=Halalkalibacter urbisdiaboli TaxID=1960589 RepID=UPI000B446784|nr:hypothetical protein [Halalkalibacter urbisdiaboli]